MKAVAPSRDIHVGVSAESKRIARYRKKYNSQPTEQLHLRLLRGGLRREAFIAIRDVLSERDESHRGSSAE